MASPPASPSFLSRWIDGDPCSFRCLLSTYTHQRYHRPQQPPLSRQQTRVQSRTKGLETQTETRKILIRKTAKSCIRKKSP